MEYGSLRVLPQREPARAARQQLSVPVASFGAAHAADAESARRVAAGAGDRSRFRRDFDRRRRGARIAHRAGRCGIAQHQRRGWRAMAITGGLVGLIFWGAFAWWNADANAYATLAKFSSPPKMRGDARRRQSHFDPADRQLWLKRRRSELLMSRPRPPDASVPGADAGLDRIWHLHPERTEHGIVRRELALNRAGPLPRCSPTSSASTDFPGRWSDHRYAQCCGTYRQRRRFRGRRDGADDSRESTTSTARCTADGTRSSGNAKRRRSKRTCR